MTIEFELDERLKGDGEIIGELKLCSIFYISMKEYIQNFCCEADEWVEEIKKS